MLLPVRMPSRAAWQSAFVWLAGATIAIGTIGFAGAMTLVDQHTGTTGSLSALNPEVVWQ